MKTHKRLWLTGLLSLALAVTLVACGNKQEDVNHLEEFSVSEQELYNDNGIKVTCTSATYGQNGCILNLTVENTGAEYREVTFGPMALNGIYLPGDSMMAFVNAGETAEAYDRVEPDVVTFAGLTSIDTVQFPLNVHDGDYNFYAKDLILDVEVDSPKGSNTFGLSKSDVVVYDADGVTASYQGSGTGVDGEFRAYFLVENSSDKDVTFNGVDQAEAMVDGEIDTKYRVDAFRQDVPAGKAALVYVHFFDLDAESNDFKTIDVNMRFVPKDEYKETKVPLHMTRTGDELSVEADAPVYPEE